MSQPEWSQCSSHTEEKSEKCLKKVSPKLHFPSQRATTLAGSNTAGFTEKERKANRINIFSVLENGTKWEVEGGLGEYGCKRRPDESVQIIGSSYIYNMENIFLFQFGNIFSPIGKSFCLIWKYIFSKFRSEYLSKLINKHGWMQTEA